MIRGFSACLALLVSALGTAKPDFPQKLGKLVDAKAKLAIERAGCGLCHAPAPPRRNALGNAIDDALVDLDKTGPDAELLAALAKSDSDRDGRSDADELRAGTSPILADAPGGSKEITARATSSGAPDPGVQGSGARSSIPNHSFHPALVHFPLAMLVFSALAEVMSRRKRNDEGYRTASRMTLAFALVTSIGAIVTGITAMLRLGFALEGTMMFHLVSSSLSVILALLAYLKRHAVRDSGYLALILLSAAIALVAGHLGGDMVHGSG